MNSKSFLNSSPWPYLALHGWVSQTAGSDSIAAWATVAVHQSQKQVSHLPEDHIKGQARCHTLSAASTLCTSLIPGIVPRAGEDRAQKVSKQTSWLLDHGKCWQHCKHIALSPSKCTVNKVVNAVSHTPWFSSKQWEDLWAHMVTAGLHLNRSAALKIQIPKKHHTYN